MNSVPLKFQNWRVDPDGILRVTAHVLKEGVYPYSAEETGPDAPADPVMQYIPLAEFTETALASLEGKPVTIPCTDTGEDWHQWRDARNALTDGLTVGTVAGRPRLTPDGCIECDLLIFDPRTVEAVKQRALVEVSAGYDGTMDIGPGTFKGIPYHARQRDLRFNHVLLLPEGLGRCGHSVRIINQRGACPPAGTRGDAPQNQKEGAIMPNPRSIKVMFGNAARTYRFTNEEDAAVAESLAEEQRAFQDEALQSGAEARESLEIGLAALRETVEALEAELAEAKARLEAATSPASREQLADELVAQREDERAVLENEAAGEGEEERAAFANALAACPTMRERRALVVTRVMNRRGVRLDDWTPDAVDGAFRVMALNARAEHDKPEPARVPGGRKTVIANASRSASNRERMLRPMLVRHGDRPAD